MSIEIVDKQILTCPACESTHLVENSPGHFLCLFCNATTKTVHNGKLKLDGRQCAHCGQHNAGRASSCRACGQSLAQNCLNCNDALGVWQDVCPRCGTSQATFAEQLAARQRIADAVPDVAPVRTETAPTPTPHSNPAQAMPRTAPTLRSSRPRRRRKFNVWRYAWLWWLIWPLSGILRRTLAAAAPMLHNVQGMMTGAASSRIVLPVILIALGVVMLATSVARRVI